MKKTAIDRAIERLEAKRAVLDLAIAELRAQHGSTPVRRPRVVITRDVEKTAHTTG